MKAKGIISLFVLTVLLGCATNTADYTEDVSEIVSPVSAVDSRNFTVSVNYLASNKKTVGNKKYGYLHVDSRGIYTASLLSVLDVPLSKYIVRDTNEIRLIEVGVSFDTSESRAAKILDPFAMSLTISSNDQNSMVLPVALQGYGSKIQSLTNGSFISKVNLLGKVSTLYFYYYAPVNAVPVSLTIDDGTEIRF